MFDDPTALRSDWHDSGNCTGKVSFCPINVQQQFLPGEVSELSET